MKKLFFLICASVVLVACGKDAYKIKGSVEGLEDGTVMVLSTIEYNSLATLDSTVVKNGKFSFKGQTDTAGISVVTFEYGDEIGGCEFYLERGNIEMHLDAVKGYQHIGGTPNNDAFQRFIDDTEALNDEAMEIEDKIRITLASQGDCTSFYKQMDDLQESYKLKVAASIRDNANRIFGYQQLIDNYTLYEPDEVMDLLVCLAPSFGGDITFNQLTSVITSQLSTSLGRQYMDFESPILDKKGTYAGKAKLSDYVSKNKVVLLDFWASWCTPCINEIPNLKAAYKRFKSKGFEIVSVSVDDEAADWIKAVKDNGLNWIQLWNGTDDMANSPAMQYFIQSIPSTFLIDSDGVIIGRNLRGDELENALEDYFK